ncbi:MAG: hypothetical protein AAFQ41_00010 [Cyanobacteria bacterium J06623_7]
MHQIEQFSGEERAVKIAFFQTEDSYPQRSFYSVVTSPDKLRSNARIMMSKQIFID